MDSKKRDYDNMVFGTRAIMEAITSGKEIDKLLIRQNLSNDLIKELTGSARSYGIPVSYVPAEKLNRVTRKNHQGAIAFIAAVQYASLDNVVETAYQKGKNPLLIILDRVTDVRNFGAIARSAECAGADALIIPSRGAAAVNADALKTSAGALNYIPVCREENLKSTLNTLKEHGITLFACTEKADKSIYETDLTCPAAIILGSEENGISNEYLKRADYTMKIPTTGRIDSLNVSVSAAVALFEVVRQRSGSGSTT